MKTSPLTIAIDGREISTSSAGKSRYITELVRHLAALDQTNHYLIYITSPLPFTVPATMTPIPVSGPPIIKQFNMVRDAKRRGAHIFFAPTAYLPVIFSSLPVVLTIHDLALFVAPESRPAFKTVVAERLLLNQAAQKAQYVLTVSENTKQDVMRLLKIPEKSISVTPNCYNRDLFHPLSPEDSFKDQVVLDKLKIKPNYLLFVGTLEPRKNIVGIIEAYSQLPRDLQTQHPLYIGGKKGWFYEEIFAQVKKLHLEETVHFLGRVDDSDLPALYRQAHVFVFPSFYEGFGLPILESLACGTPVISANNSSLPEVVGEAGILVDAHSKSELTNAMNRMLTDLALYTQLKTKTLAQAQKFDWKKTAQATLEIFTQIRI